MKSLPMLYKKTQTGATQQWQVHIKDNTYWSVEGLVGGTLTTNSPTAAEPKNVGRANATSGAEQAVLEATAKHQKKLDKGYYADIGSIGTKKFFEPMLAHKYVDVKDKINFPVLVSPKMDGARMIVDRHGMWTRNGKPYVSTPHILHDLEPLFAEHPDWIIDGEIYSHDIPFEKIMSLVKKTKPDDGDIHESRKHCKLWIFDGVAGDAAEPYESRIDKIEKEILCLCPTNHVLPFKFVKSLSVADHANVKHHHDAYVMNGFEGLMIRIPGSPYENKRSKNLLKYKEFSDEEFMIRRFEEAKGNRAGMAGAVVLEHPTIPDKTFNAGIRGGEEYYQDLWRNRSKYVGKKATVRFQGLSTEDGTPRFPVAVQIGRDDV
jgi:DNA ligase-1